MLYDLEKDGLVIKWVHSLVESTKSDEIVRIDTVLSCVGGCEGSEVKNERLNMYLATESGLFSINWNKINSCILISPESAH